MRNLHFWHSKTENNYRINQLLHRNSGPCRHKEKNKVSFQQKARVNANMRLVVVENVLRFCRPLQTSSEGKCKRKAELVEQAFNAHSMKLAKVSEEESENENLIMAELLATDEGVLPDPASILKSNCSRNPTIFPEFTSPDICNYLLRKTNEYSEETLNSFKSLTGYKLFKDGHVLDQILMA